MSGVPRAARAILSAIVLCLITACWVLLVNTYVSDKALASCIIDITIISVFLVIYQNRKPVAQKPVTEVTMAVFLIACVLLWFGIQRSGVLIQVYVQDPMTEAYLGTMNPDSFFYLLLTLAIAPVMEELVFRDCVHRTFLKIMPSGWACVFSSLLFGLAHGTFVHVYLGFVMGVFLTYAYRVSGQLWLPVVLHSVFNLMSLYMSPGVPGLNPQEIIFLLILNIFIGSTLLVGWAFSDKSAHCMRKFYEEL